MFIRGLLFGFILIGYVLANSAETAVPGTLGVADPKFRNESELGAAVASGNSNTQTVSAKQMDEYDWTQNVSRYSGRYLDTQVSGTDTARNWDTSLRYERVISTNFNLFTSYGLESNFFAGYVQRNNFDLGAKYFFFQTDSIKFFAELGYRNIVTDYAANISNSTANAARVYSEVKYTVSKATGYRFWIEYIPTISSNNSAVGYSTAQDYQASAEPSMYTMLNDIFSLNLSYLAKWTNYLPPGGTATKNLDTVFTTALACKF